MKDPVQRAFNLALALAFALAAAPAQAELVVEDPLTAGSTVGFRDNGPGQFVAGGWMVTGPSDNIRYTPPTPIEEGAVEFDVSGLRFNDTRPQNHRGQLMSMYDASFGNPRQVYAPDIRKNPFKFVIQRNGRDETAHFANYLKFIMNTDGVNQFEGYSSVGPFPWDEGKTYHMRLEWRDGLIRFFIDGQDIDHWPFVYRSIYHPGIHDIRIGTNTRNNAIVGAVYSNVKIYDYTTAPKAPLINNPRTEVVSKTLDPIIDWAGERHSHYEVQITSSPDPNGGVVWSSGAVASSLHYAVSGPLSDNSAYFVHVRLRNHKGWGGWSEPRSFRTSTGETITVPEYKEHEIVLRTTTKHSNPYTGVSVSAVFSGPTRDVRVHGFWDGGELFKIRMLPTEPGIWHWSTSSSDPALNNLSGSFVSQASTNRGYVRASPTLPYTFEWAADAAPFFLMGDTIWHMYYNLRFLDGSFQNLIDDRATQKFNYAHGVVHDFLHNEGGSIYREQDHDREMFDTDTLAPSYFHMIDRKIDYMNAQGMVAGLVFSWGNEGYQEYETAEQYQRYIRYLVSRYGSKNVFWILVGEFEEAEEPRSRWRDYMGTLRATDPYGHPVSLHTIATTDVFGPDEELSFVSQQRYGSPDELAALVAESRVYDKPVVNLEYGYEGNPNVFVTNQPPDEVRRDHYALVLAGGYGIYGNHTIGYSTYHRVGDFVLTATDTPGAQFLTILYDFFSQTNFHRLEPAQELVSRGIAAAWENVEYVVQLPSGGEVEVDLARASGLFSVDWFNPRTGVRSSHGATSAGDFRSFTAPDENDWILHIYNYPLDGSGSVHIDLGESNTESGLTHPQVEDGETTPWIVASRDARRNLDPSRDFYFYFGVSDGFSFRGNHPEAFITIEYFDTGSGALTLQYDARDGTVHKDGGSLFLTGSDTWKSHTFRVTDAYFGNRQSGGADFRIFGGVDRTFYLDVVRVSTHEPGPPATASSPNPADGSTGVGPTPLLSWTAGLGASAHDVYFGTTSPPPFHGRQKPTTVDPGPLSPSTTYFWRVDEVNSEGVTPGPIWRFTTGSTPRAASNPSPSDAATAVSVNTALGWADGGETTSHEVHFGSSAPPALVGRVSGTSFDPGPLSPNTTYFWRIDAVNGFGTTPGAIWSFTTSDAVSVPTLDFKLAELITVDGDPSDWNLAEFVSKVRAGEAVRADIALVGYDEGMLFVSGYATHLTLPESAADHTARVYGRHDADSLYFLFRVDDEDIQVNEGRGMNWANDCVEIYIDPAGDGGSSPMNDSVSEVQLVIDAGNQKNVYVTTSEYQNRVLDGVLSSVSTDASGYWVEVRILKSVLSPNAPAEGAFGLDFNFRDNDRGNDPNQTTVYTWADGERSASFPSKIPDRWGNGFLPVLAEPTQPSPVENPSPADGATEVNRLTRLSWESSRGASSYDVYFGGASPPPYVTSQLETSFDPGDLEPDADYFWRVDATNSAGTTQGPVWRFTTGAEVAVPTLNIQPAGAITIDGNVDDWDLSALTRVVRAGDVIAGDVALVGFDGGTLYWSGRYTGFGLPKNASDHTARVYARHDAEYLYFLLRLDDDQVQVQFGPEMNWANDSAEIYIDPSGDGGASPLSNSSSDIQLVIDAANQQNVYVTNSAYREQILSDLQSAVSIDATGWWLEVRIGKSVLEPDLPSLGSFGLDFNFRDNDNGNDPTQSSVYTWSDTEESGGFPSKIPNRWGSGRLQ